MKIKLTYLVLLLIFVIANMFVITKLYQNKSQETYQKIDSPKTEFWPVRSIDTMKYSRDLAREKLHDPNFAKVIDQQISDIAQTGATHVAIATPYDQEFYPFLQQWVDSARKHHLKVWFRGNWSGWERWFNYPSITPEQHLSKTKNFILQHPEIFQDGDIFTSCTECENGGPGDPRFNGQLEDHRQFLINEYQTMQQAFQQINKQVTANYFSMNGDVARLVMDADTVQKLGGVITIDHYVESPQKLAEDIKKYHQESNAQIILGEVGAPIPDIHGKMNEEEQSRWMEEILHEISDLPYVQGINYWTNTGSSTALWDKDGQPKYVVNVLKQYYQPQLLQGRVVNQWKRPIASAKLKMDKFHTETDRDGNFHLLVPKLYPQLQISAQNYQPQNVAIETIDKSIDIKLSPQNPNIIERIIFPGN